VLNLSGTAPIAGGPHVMTVHDVLPLTNPEWFSRAFSTWYRTVVPHAARAAAAIVTVSEQSAAEIERVLRVDGDRVHVVTQGLAPFDRPASRSACREVLGALGIDSPFLLAAGEGDPRKNIAFLEVVLRRWRARGESPPPLVVTGVSRPHVHGGKARTGGAGIIRIGHVSDRELHGLYTAAAAFCFPSLAEGFGRPPLEAVACGTPAIVAPFAGADARFGAIARVLPLDADAWVDVLRAFASVEGHSDSTAGPAIGSADLATRFSWDAAATRVLHACRTALELGTGEAAIR
jgi:glycosyltransferase involved in cell wall biosynthesis